MIIFKDDEILLDLPKMLSETDLIKDIENRYIQIEPQTEIGQLMNFLNNIETWSISRDIPWDLLFQRQTTLLTLGLTHHCIQLQQC